MHKEVGKWTGSETYETKTLHFLLNEIAAKVRGVAVARFFLPVSCVVLTGQLTVNRLLFDKT